MKYLVIAILALAGLIVLLGSITKLWIGYTELAVVFVVTDASTKKPIEGATIEIESRELEGDRTISLSTGADGAAVRLQHCTTTGAKNLFKDTWGVRLPDWKVRISAPGYSPTEWVELDAFVNRQNVQRSSPVTTLPITVKLKKEEK